MSSTNKTGLGFNQWILADKPTMEDFNADNVLVEQLLEERCTKSETDERFMAVEQLLDERYTKSEADGKFVARETLTANDIMVSSPVFPAKTSVEGALVKLSGEKLNKSQIGTFQVKLEKGTATYSISTGTYCKTGNMVVAHVALVLSSAVTGAPAADRVDLVGLPFPAYGGNARFIGTSGYTKNFTNVTGQVRPRIALGTKIECVVDNSGTSGIHMLTYANLTATSQFDFTVIYFTAQ